MDIVATKNSALIESLPFAAALLDSDGNGIYLNQRTTKLFYPGQLVTACQFNITQLSSHFNQHDFEQSRHWLEANSTEYFQLETHSDLKQVNGQFRIKLSKMEAQYLCCIEPLKSSAENNKTHTRNFAELKKISRLSAMREISSLLADKLNQPLTAILSYTQAMQRMYNTNAEQEELLQVMQRVVVNAQVAGQIIRDIRGIFKPPAYECKHTDINQLIKDVIDLTELNSTTSNIRLKTDFDENLPQVCIDIMQIKLVIFSLISNSMESILSELCQNAEISLASHFSDTQLIISIADNGPGVSQEVLQSPFDPFVASANDGLGVSLSMCRNIMEMHNGKITVTANTIDPSNGSGTVVTLYLPKTLPGINGVINEEN